MRTAIKRLLTVSVITVAMLAPDAIAQNFCTTPTPTPSAPPQSDPHPQCETCESYCRHSPCYIGTGVYTTDATDLAIPTAGFPLELSRTYENQRVIDGPLGVGWRSSLTARVNYRTYLYSAPNGYRMQTDVVLPSGWTITFTESTSGAFIPPTGRHDSLVHNTDGTWTYTPPRSRAALRFNTDGAIASIADESDNRLNFTYGTNGRLAQVADAAGSGRTLIVTWGTDGRISSVNDFVTTDPSYVSRFVKYHYDTADGTLIGVADPVTSAANDDATRYEYTQGRFGPVLSKIRDRWNRLVSALDWYPSGMLKSYTEGEYNDANPSASTGEKYTYTYNSSTQTTKANSLGSRAYSFGPTGLVNDHAVFSSTTGLPSSTTDDFGYSTTYTYDANGKITQKTVNPGGVYATTFMYAYDANFPDHVSLQTSSRPAERPGFRYVYYPPGNASAGKLKEVHQLRKNGSTEDLVAYYEYNSRGQVTLATEDGTSTAYSYNTAGDVVAISRTGLGTMTYTYDSMGRMTASTDMASQSTAYTYDALGRVTSVTLPKPVAGSSLNFITQYSYDNYEPATGLNYTNVTDPNGRVTRQGFDALRHLLKTVDALQNETLYTYQYNLLRTIRDANGNVTTYSYDANRNLASTMFPDTKVESYVHTQSGDLQQVTDRRGITRSYTYNAFGQLIAITYPGASIGFSWLGDLPAGGSEAVGSISLYTDTIEYDDSFRVAKEERVNGYKITYTYGNDLSPVAPLASYTVAPPSGSSEPSTTVSYGYDAAQRVISIAMSGISGFFTYTYAPNGQYDTITFPNTQKRRYQYDLQGRLTRVSNTIDAPTFGTIADFEYAYDYNWTTQSYSMLGQRTSVTLFADPDSGMDTGLTKYHYDALYQLTKATYGNADTQSWTYDAIGNRTSATTNGITANYSYYYYAANPNNSSRLQNVGNGPSQIAYDFNGNVIDGLGASMTWDYANRLGTQGNEQYEYDYRDRRTRAGQSLLPSTLIYQGLNVVRERNSSGLRDDYLFGPGIDEPLARRNAAGVVTYYAVDGLGSIVGEVDGTTFIDGTAYGAFGDFRTINVHSAAPPTRSRFSYTGREHVGASSRYYYRARYYDATIGRFISEDPIDSTPGRSPYAYVRNSPSDLTDPSGLQACYREPNCNDINRDIENLVNDMRRWLSEFRDDTLPLSGRNSVRGHQKRFRQAQERLLALIEKHRRHNCITPLPSDANELATRGVPNPRPLPPRHRFNWEQIWNVCCNFVL